MIIKRGIVLIEQKSKSGGRTFQIKETINTIEDVAAFILDMMDEQKKGN